VSAPSAFSPVTMIALVLVGVFSLSGLSVLSAYAPELRSGDNGQAHALSRSSVGFAAVARLLRATGTPVINSRGPLKGASGDGLLVLTPQASTAPEQVGDMAHDGPVLIVLPKWRTLPDPQAKGWARTVGRLTPAESLAPLPKRLHDGVALRRREPGATTITLYRPDGRRFGTVARVDAPQTLMAPGWIPVLVDEAGAPVLAMAQSDRTYVLADPDLLNTQGLKTPETARTAVALLALIRAPDTPVTFDLTLHGFKRTRSLARLLLEPPLLGVTLCLLAAALLVGMQAAVRFGPATAKDREVAFGKRALADNTAGLVRLARREHRMAAPYALIVRAAAARAVGAPRQLDGAELEAFLDRLSAVGGLSQRYSPLAERARAAKTVGDLMLVARDLYLWRLEMTHERR